MDSNISGPEPSGAPSARAQWAAVLDELEAAEAALLRAPVHSLSGPQLLELIRRRESLERRTRAHQQRLLGRLVAESVAGSVAGSVGKALRISPAEAHRRITEARGLAS